MYTVKVVNISVYVQKNNTNEYLLITCCKTILNIAVKLVNFMKEPNY